MFNMSGRPKKQVYQYTYDMNGKFIKKYSSESEVRRTYFCNDIGKRPIFVGKDYAILSDNTLISTKKIGREGVRQIIKRENSPYIKLGNIIKEVEIYNLDKVKIATFASPSIASKITNISENTIRSSFNKGAGYGSWNGLLFKYKN